MSELKATGTVHKLFELTQVSEKFTKQEIVLKIEGQYPQYVKFEASQSRCDELQKVKEGDTITVHYNLKGREWINPQGEAKYFNTLDIWRI